MDDFLALEALLELSHQLNSKNQCQLDVKKFPLLDKPVVVLAMESVAYILENTQKWRMLCTNLMKKWCDVRDIGVSCRHQSWMVTSSATNYDCLLSVCNALVDPNSTSNLLSLELPQQQALCLALTCLADKSERARKLTVKVFELIINDSDLTNNHLDFLTEIWKLKGLLELSSMQVEELVLKCPCGLEKELISYATNSIRNEGLEVDIYKQEEEFASLVSLCISTPNIFQVTTSILMHLIQTSQAQQDTVNILTDFVQRCTFDEQKLVELFPAKCQVALALLSVSPEETDQDSYIGYLLNAMADLPPSTASLLVILNQKWMPLLTDKL